MFQDYCMAHGNAVMPGSLYCCDECRDQDIDGFYMESPVGSPLDVPSDVDDHLMYECWFCQSHHEPNEACNGHNYATSTTGDNYIPRTQPRDDSITSYALEVFGNESTSEGGENEILNSNELIQSNYRKWLVNMTPR